MNEEVIREENEFPSDLEERMAAVLNGVNTELKAVTILHLDDRPAEAKEIKTRVRETRGSGYLPHFINFNSYGNTLHDIALVAKETIVRDTGEKLHVGYSLTEAGRVYGRQVAAFSLRYAVESNGSMYEILGPTLSKGSSRAPHNRVRILEELNRGELREVDLVDSLELSDAGALMHIEALGKIGLVSFDSVGAKQKGKCMYRWIDGKDAENVETVVNYKTLTKDVALKLAKLEESDYNEIAKSLNYGHPKNVSHILSGLEKQGFVERVLWKGKNLKSKVKILEGGREFLKKFVYPIKEILGGNRLLIDREIDEIREIYTARGIDLYRAVSPQINRKSPEERIEQVKRCLRENPGMTSKEICEVIGISKGQAGLYLRKIEGKRREKEGQEVRYFLK